MKFLRENNQDINHTHHFSLYLQKLKIYFILKEIIEEMIHDV